MSATVSKLRIPAPTAKPGVFARRKARDGPSHGKQDLMQKIIFWVTYSFWAPLLKHSTVMDS